MHDIPPPTHANVNTFTFPVCSLGRAVHAKMMYCASQGHIQMGILFVYACYVNCKMVACQNVTPGLF